MVRAWDSLEAGLVVYPDQPLDHAAARRSPCQTCVTKICCVYMPLHSFRADDVAGLDKLGYLLGFDRIELGLTPDWMWTAYYRAPCRHLDRDTLRCQIFGRPERPRVCRSYDAYDCWYKDTLSRAVSPGFLRVDRRRLAVVLDHLRFDHARQVVVRPDWDELSAALAAVELPAPDDGDGDGDDGDDSDDDSKGSDGGASENRTLPIADPPAPVSENRTLRTFDELAEPCAACSAHCCKLLMFPLEHPKNLSEVDYLRFLLGFGSIEIGVSDRGWSLIVHTSCRHLRGDRCGVYGHPERPLQCVHYDEAKCWYKPRFGRAYPDGFTRVRYQQFPALAAAFGFDDDGLICDFPDAARVRDSILQTRDKPDADDADDTDDAKATADDDATS